MLMKLTPVLKFINQNQLQKLLEKGKQKKSPRNLEEICV